jgi:hypothetical protein
VGDQTIRHPVLAVRRYREGQSEQQRRHR